MRTMGSQTPVTDLAAVNGHTLEPFHVTRCGPAADWPRTGGEATSSQSHRWRRVVSAHRGWLAAIPVVLVNAVAFGAQLAFWRAHLGLALEAVAVALATESIANYLAWQAHLAQLADDAALRLRLAAYGTALVIGALNYSHYMLRGWRPTVAAVTFGMMSAISPWLWSVHSRRVSRDALKSRGLIEPHAVRLGTNRWLWHPLKSAQVMFRATWEGETDPARAIALIAPEVTDVAPPQATSGIALDVTPEAGLEVAPGPAVQVTSEPAAGNDAEPAAEVTPSRPDPAPVRRRQVSAKPKPQVTPARVSDADLLEQVRAELAADPDANISTVAKTLGRSRDRIRPLHEQVRASL